MLKILTIKNNLPSKIIPTRIQKNRNKLPSTMNQTDNKDQQLKSSITALLFVKGEPVSVGTLCLLTKEKKEKIKDTLKEIKGDLNSLGLDLFCKKNLYQITTHSSKAPLVQEFLQKEKDRPLGEAAWEVLAIIAYLGPISLEKVELIRGVNSGKTIRELSIRGYVEKKELHYCPTLKFFKALGVSSQEDLEEFKLLRENEKVKSIL